jgi:hypothetical protein
MFLLIFLGALIMNGEYKFIILLLIFSMLLASATLYFYFSERDYNLPSHEILAEKPVTVGLFVEGNFNNSEVENGK